MSNKNEKFRRDISRHNVDCFEARRESEIRKKSPKYKEMQADNNERYAIRDIIMQMAKDGKKKIDILINLNNKFPDSKNSRFFSTWIDHYFKKLKIKEDNSEEIGIE